MNSYLLEGNKDEKDHSIVLGVKSQVPSPPFSFRTRKSH